MTLTPPNLDSRSFDDLVKEARDRIPRFTPEWTNFNDSDPGMTLVKLHAWMTETILWELNRVPELNYIKFLELVGIDRRPARPARTRLKAELDKLGAPGDPLVVDVPLGARVAVDDPGLERELVFETDTSLRAINAEIAAVIVPSGALSPARKLVTAWEDGLTWLHNFDPLADAAVGTAMYVGLLLRPNAKPPMDQYSEDRMPAGTLALHADTIEVLDEAAGGAEEIVEGPASLRCANPTDAGTAADRLEWQAFAGDAAAEGLFSDGSDAGWRDLAVSGRSRSPSRCSSAIRTRQVSWLPEACEVWNSQSRPSGAGKITGFCSEWAASSLSWATGPQAGAPGRSTAARMQMSDLPSSEPPNQAQSTVPSTRPARKLAWFCTTGDGRNASSRPSSTRRSVPVMSRAISSTSIGDPPLSRGSAHAGATLSINL